MEICVDEDALENVAALKVAMKRLAEKYGCGAIAIQCWNQLQNEIGIMPCAANALLSDEEYRWSVKQIFTVPSHRCWWRLPGWARRAAFC